MKKMDDYLLEEISDFLVVYLKQGQIRVNSFIKKTDLPLSQLDKLLKIHFLLKSDVKRFVNDMPYMIRSLKTSTTIQNVTHHGQIKGKINWQRTIKEPERIRSKNKMIVSVNEQNREYAIKENLIVLEALETIHHILMYHIDFNHLQRYEWFNDWNYLKNILENVLNKNVYLSRIRKNRKDVTDRMIMETVKHRNPLYRNAASILLEYKRIQAHNLKQDEILQLLKETFVYPQEEDVLFELYWVMKFVKQNASNATLQLIDGKNNLVAKWEDARYQYNIYHDSTGSSRLKFSIPIKEISGTYHPYTKRKIQSLKQADEAINDLFGRVENTRTYWRGRPDIVVEVYDKKTENLQKVIIGEVKHTVNLGYAKTGLRELADYIHLIKDEDDYYLNDWIPVHGILCTARIEKYEKQGTDLSMNNFYKDIHWKSL